MAESHVLQPIFSDRGNIHLTCDGYKFKPYRRVVGTEERGWRCCGKNSRCSVKLFTVGSENLFSRLEGTHDHTPVPEHLLNRRMLSNSVKTKGEALDERPSKLIRKEVDDNPTTVNTLTRKDVRYIRNNITHARLKSMPKLPKSAMEIQVALSQMEVTTTKGEAFVLNNDMENCHVVFSTDSNLQYLCQQETILMDGTFQYAAKHFLQLFTIHSYSGGSYIPLVFSLIKDKKKETYLKIIQCVQDECRKRQLSFNPKTVVIDFEQSIHESIKVAFPSVKITGCRFHLAQAW